MGLTEHQEIKLNESLEILKKGKRLLLSGSAGVGKTYLVNELIKRLAITMPSFKKIYCSAPTNKAVAVVKGKVDKRDNLEFVTVHSALKIKRNINFRTGAISFKPNFTDRYPPLKGVGLFIIDEGSMLPKELLEYVEEHATKNKISVIFIGDHKQLNPVNEEISPIFEKGYPEVELTEIIRQGAGNPIIELSRNLEAVVEKKDKRTEAGGFIFSNNEAQVVATLAVVNGTDELKYLAYTNAEVDRINRLVRHKIYGESPKKIELEETLVFNGPFKDNEYYTNQEIKVETLKVEERDFFYPSGKQQKSVFETVTSYNRVKLKFYSINKIYNEETKSYEENVIVIHEDSQAAYDKLLKNLKSMCSAKVIGWIDFYKFKETFADLKYNHAITVHKSQGSTYQQTIVNIKNLGINRNKTEREKLLYTAVTRASKLLILYKV